MPNSGMPQYGQSRKKLAKVNPFLNSQTFFNMNSGAFDLGWLLEDGETEEDLAVCRYISEEERKEFVEKAFKGDVDHLHLVKWR